MKRTALFLPILLVGCATKAPESKPATAAKEVKPELEAPIKIEGRPGGFDFVTYDEAGHRIIAAHKAAGTGEIFDPKTGELKSVNVGEAQGVAVDGYGKRYFFGDDEQKSVVVVNSESLKVSAKIKLSGAVDAIAFDEQSGLIYAAEDDGDKLWVVDPTKKKKVGEVKLPGVPESMQVDGAQAKLYVNIKNLDEVAIVDTKSRRVESTISTHPATGPHGLVLDAKKNRLYSAGKDGQLVAIDLAAKKVVASVAIATGNDQIGFDIDGSRLFTSGRDELSIVKITGEGFGGVESVKTPHGARSLAYDPIGNAVWLAYGDKNESFLQKLLVH